MTEAEWLACDNPHVMIHFLPHSVWGERRGRLFTVACCRLLQALPDERLAHAIEVAERFADKQADDVELCAAIQAVWDARHDMTSWQSHAAEVVASAVQYPAEEYSAINELITWTQAEHRTVPGSRVVEDRWKLVLANLVRELVCNPFRPVAFSPTWRTAIVVALARQMYEARQFDTMPILADALEDAGCEDEQLLGHCRSAGAHVRGCWVVDLVLGLG